MSGLTTKRLVLAQVLVCFGCCCGQTGRGRPEVPVEFLKSEWRKRGLMKRIQLTISGCLGPCDVPNVVLIVAGQNTLWLGNLKGSDYQELMDWAVRCNQMSRAMEIPKSLRVHEIAAPFIPQTCEGDFNWQRNR
jgi:hypothetical protein